MASNKRRSGNLPEEQYVRPPPPHLNEEERLWVISLQDELRRMNHNNNNSPHQNQNVMIIRPISEFEFVSHALICKNQSNKGKNRMIRMEKFKQFYHIPEHPTVYEAIKSVETFLYARPNFIQSIHQDLISKRWILSYQLKALTDIEYHHEELTVEQEFTGLYFLLTAMQPDLDSIRNGTVWIGDLQGMTVQNLSMYIVNGIRALCRDSFPIKVCDVPCWNTPPKFSAAYAICRPFFSTHLSEKLVWDCTPERIQQFFSRDVLPKSLGGTTQSQHEIMGVIEINLRQRFENQSSFQLRLPAIGSSKDVE